MTEYDVIIIGAGSVGVPSTFALAKAGLKVLCLEQHASPGQGENKKAIGGVRATHTQKGKIWIGQESIKILSEWEKKYNENIEWIKGGYSFICYDPQNEKIFRENIKLQKSCGLNINWLDANKISDLIPGINQTNLLGGTYSPDDGNVSPWLTINSFYFNAINQGAEFHFKEEMLVFIKDKNEITGVKTNKGTYKAQHIINTTGAYAGRIGNLLGINLPIYPESHEAGITEPMKKFFDTMIVDVRKAHNDLFGDSLNYYFYQNTHGQIVFCITPEPPIVGMDERETSNFLPQVSQRMINLIPRLKNIRVRRTWRGLYPMTPDGGPIVGPIKEYNGLINAVGMCGQGLMLGPGIGELITRVVTEKLTAKDREILEEFSFYRNFGKIEHLK